MNRVLIVLTVAMLAVFGVFAVQGSGSPTTQAQESCPLGHAGISRTTSTHNSITAYWDEHSHNDKIAQGYYVSHRVKGGSDWVRNQAIGSPLGGSTRSYTITGLTADTKYDVLLGYLLLPYGWQNCGRIFETGTEADPSATPTPSPTATPTAEAIPVNLLVAAITPARYYDESTGATELPESDGNGVTISLYAQLTAVPTTDKTFTLEVGGTATKDDDYEFDRRDTISFTIAAGNIESAIEKVKIRARCDDELDNGETITFRLVGNTNSNTYVVHLADDCNRGPQVRFVESAYSGSEGDSVVVTLRSEPIIDNAFTATVSASSGDDLKDDSWNVTFPGGVGLVSFYVEIEEDSVFEPSAETVTLSIGSGAGKGYRLGSPSESTLTIAAETPDTVEIQFNPTMHTVTEGVDSQVEMTVKTADGEPVDRDVSFTVTANDAITDKHKKVADENATEIGQKPSKNSTGRVGEDYTAINHSGTIASGESEATVYLPVLDDQVAEKPEQVWVELATSAEGVGVVKGTVVLVSIVDNDVVSVRPNQSYLETGEFSGKTTMTVRLNRAFSAKETMTLAFSTDDSSIATVEPATVEIEGSDWDDPITVTVKAVSDTDYETELTNVNVGLEHASFMVQLLDNKIPVLAPDTDLARLPKTEICAKSDVCKGSFYAAPAIGQLGAGLLSPRIYLSEPAPKGGVTFRIRQLGGNDVTLFEQQVTVPQNAQNIIYNVMLPRNGSTFRIEVAPTDINWVRAWDGADVATLYGVGSIGGL